MRLYARNNQAVPEVYHGSIFNLPFADGSLDGIYNLGVIEHFTPEEIRQILTECHRTLKPGGKIVLFWPHRWATSVLLLRVVKFLIKLVTRRAVEFHPAEITYCKGNAFAQSTLRDAGFVLSSYEFWVARLIRPSRCGRLQEARFHTYFRINLAS